MKQKNSRIKSILLLLVILFNLWNTKTLASNETTIDASIDINWEMFIINTSIPKELEQQWIKDLLSIGQSNFWNSIPSRIQNIQAAAIKLDWIIIENWETFSYNKALWPLTANYWFTMDQIISWWNITWAMWWWVCQLSTSILRAAMNSWLKIDAFRNHSIAIPYYFPYWLDSTVYSKYGLDLRFTNNTNAPIYMKTFIIKNELIAIFYWSSDWRKVKLEWPYVNSVNIWENELKKFNYKSFLVQYKRTTEYNNWEISEEMFSSQYWRYWWSKKKHSKK